VTVRVVVVAAAVVALTSGCGGTTRHETTTAGAAHDGPTCQQLFARLERIRVPRTTRERRRYERELAATARQLETRFHLDVGPSAVRLAGVALLRRQAAEAFRSGRSAEGQRLSVHARILQLGAMARLTNLATRCP
jgi:hypothetical protein